jgi:hypothetical protein
MAEELAALKGSTAHYLEAESVDRLYRSAERHVYPSRHREGAKPGVIT